MARLRRTARVQRSARALVLAAIAPASASASVTGDAVWLNEVLASHVGIDVAEYVELAGTAGAPLEGLSLVVVEGDAGIAPGRVDRRIDFRASHALGANGLFLVGNCSGLAARYGALPDRAIQTNFLENSSLTLALVETESLRGPRATGEERVLDALALSDGDPGDVFFFGAPVLGPDGPFFPAGARRSTDGQGWAIADFALGGANTPTGGGGNGCVHLDVPIPAIQGRGVRSPFEQEPVRTTGVVTLKTRTGRGLWLQDPTGDADPATADAVFVSGGPELESLEPGDRVRIAAIVAEQQNGSSLGRTQLVDVSGLELISTGNRLPEPVRWTRLPDVSLEAAIAFWERHEGMRVAVERARVVAPSSDSGEFVLVARANARPRSGFSPRTGHLLLRDLDGDGVDYNPERIPVGRRTRELPEVRPRDRVRRLVGVVDYASRSYRLEPERLELRRARIPRRLAHRRRGPRGDATIATWNLRNLFDLEDETGKDDAASTPRPDELETRLAKLALGVEHELRLPDVLVVQEVENQALLQRLGDRVNARAGTRYTATSFETSDPRGIEVGFLWDAARVALLDAFPLSGAAVRAAFGPASGRPGREPLAGRFRIGASELTIVANHFTSKLGDDPLHGVNQPPLRPSEAQRKAQASAVRAFAETLLADDPEALVMVTGDLNDFAFAEPGEGADHPLAILEGRGREPRLVNLLALERPGERFTFVFEGNAQALDHMLVSSALLRRTAGADVLHFNASFPAALAREPGHALRASDHDPLEGRFRLRR
jgi:predicted extracellular nuclease